MRRRSYELWLALGAILVITLLYLWAVSRLDGPPAAGELLGHGLGITGFALMLMTETLYSVRKRSLRARWGRMSSWLRFHIFTGLVGPYLVLLHSSWKFNGLAGVLTALMVVVVLSGIVGRYIYTAVPRTADGVEIDATELESRIAMAEAELQRWLVEQPEVDPRLVDRLASLSQPAVAGPQLVLGRTLSEWRYRLSWWRERRQALSLGRTQLRALHDLLRQRRALQRQLASLALARRLLATWHTVHIPIGMALFTAAAVHIGGAIYYASLLK